MTSAADVITAWDAADPVAIHPTRAISEEAYWASGAQQAKALTGVIPAGSTVLDYGCGDGRVAIPLAKLGYKVVGVDSSRRMLEALKANCPVIGCCLSDGRDLRLDEPVDVAVCLAVLIHHGWADGEAIVGAISRVVRPGGLLVLDWPTSGTPQERRTWIEVTTWPVERRRSVMDQLSLDPVSSDLPWLVLRKRGRRGRPVDDRAVAAAPR